MPSLKERILKYKDKKSLSYRELAEWLGLENHQNLYHWLHNRDDSFGEGIERKFNALSKR